MIGKSPDSPQMSLFNLIGQLDHSEPLLKLGHALDWASLEDQFAVYYSHEGRKSKPIRLMVGMLILKQMNDLSDEEVVIAVKQNPYYQSFCGFDEFQLNAPCDATQLVKFRNRIGPDGVASIFGLSVQLHGKAAEEKTVLVDTTVQEKAITYPTDSKLAIKIINRLNKLAKHHGIRQRRTYVKEVKQLRLACRNFNHPRRRTKAKGALKRLRTIAGILMRELQRKLPADILAPQKDNFALYARVLAQQPQDKNKIYSLHEPDIYCVGKGKDHKKYEYGRKASIVSTITDQIIVGVHSHDDHEHDSKTLNDAIKAAESNRKQKIKLAVVDRGYRGCTNKVECDVLLPNRPLKKDSHYERQKKRALCRRRAAIEPLIGHLKHDYRLTRNWLKGSDGDQINLLMAACAWNLRKWMVVIFFLKNGGQKSPFMFLIWQKPTQTYAQWLIVSYDELD